MPANVTAPHHGSCSHHDPSDGVQHHVLLNTAFTFASVPAGKSTLVSAALADTPGVVTVCLSDAQYEAGHRSRRDEHRWQQADPSVHDNDIVKRVLRAVAGLETMLDPERSAKRVIGWHKRFFGVPPTVLLRVSHGDVRTTGSYYSSKSQRRAAGGPGIDRVYVRNALQTLAREYGLHIVVDSDNTDVGAAGLAAVAVKHFEVSGSDSEGDPPDAPLGHLAYLSAIALSGGCSAPSHRRDPCRLRSFDPTAIIC